MISNTGFSSPHRHCKHVFSNCLIGHRLISQNQVNTTTGLVRCGNVHCSMQTRCSMVDALPNELEKPQSRHKLTVILARCFRANKGVLELIKGQFSMSQQAGEAVQCETEGTAALYCAPFLGAEQGQTVEWLVRKTEHGRLTQEWRSSKQLSVNRGDGRCHGTREGK